MGNKGSKTHYVPEDENGNLELLDHRLGVNSVARFEYGYDRNGMRTSMTEPLNTSTGSPYIQCPIIHIM